MSDIRVEMVQEECFEKDMALRSEKHKNLKAVKVSASFMHWRHWILSIDWGNPKSLQS